MGQYSAVAQQAEELLKRQKIPGVAETAAEAAIKLGEIDRALGFLKGINSIAAGYLRGQIALEKGNKAEASAEFEKIISQWTSKTRMSSDELGIAAVALEKLGRYEEANQIYREATEIDPKNPALKAAWGRLLVKKYNPADAEGLFKEALEINTNHTGALLGMAELSSSRWESRVPGMLNRILQINPSMTEARVMLARIDLERDNYVEASKQLDRALQVNPKLLEAWSLRAVASFLEGKEAADQLGWIARILKENPSFGKVYADLGDFAVLQRQYKLAVDYYRRAVDTDPDLSQTRASLGINLFRLGEDDAARHELEEAYRRDPYNIWTVNTLRLMDSFKRFDSFETQRFRVKLHQKETQILQSYISDILEESLQDLSQRYQYIPDQKVVFEMYPDHEDFAVRTLGLPGLGALGASFGPVVAMDSPSARRRGEFHWGSTLWHELAHVITLGITDNRIPRWFTEGLSVYEENTSRPGWGDPMTPGIVQALQLVQTIPLADLNTAFIRPSQPGMVPFAYFQAGMICEYLVEKHGFEKILAMLSAYREKQKDAAVLKQVLGLTLEEFDKQFRDYAREKTYGFAKAVDFQWSGSDHSIDEIKVELQKNPDNFFAQLHIAEAYTAQSKFAEAVPYAEVAKALFPPFVDDGNPYIILADCYEVLGQKEKAAVALLEWKKYRGRDPEVFKRLSKLLSEIGKQNEAVQVLSEALNVAMFDVDIHQQLAERLAETSPQKAIEEYKVLLALNPPDKAEAHYRLAAAYHSLSDTSNARQHVLAALEIAPGYRDAQKLLLELTGQ